MKIKLFRAILVVLLICTMTLIFGFSSQNGTQSKGISMRISEYILKFSYTYQEAEQKQKEKILNRTNAIIRKVAHFSIYTILGILLMGLMTKTKVEDNKRIYITLGIGLLYAITDEFHQNFSPGRTPKVTDVYIDMLGVAIGMLLVLFVRQLYNEILQKYYKKYKKCHTKSVENKKLV